MPTALSPITLSDLAQGRAVPFIHKPYWWEAMPTLAHDDAVSGFADVAVVGSGFTGLSAALTLARAGRSVTILEAGTAGYGASTRNGGQVGSGNQKFRVKTLIDMMGMKKSQALLMEGVAKPDNMETLITDAERYCFFKRRGRSRGAVRQIGRAHV